MAYYTYNQVSAYAKISQYLATVDIAKKKYFNGGFLDADLPLKIYLERESMEFLYEQDPTSEDLDGVLNYVTSLCGKYLLEAQAIVSVGGSGTVVVPSITGGLVRIDFQVGQSGYPASGDSTFTDSRLVGRTVDFYREGELKQLNNLVDGYTFDSLTGAITAYPDFFTNERISIRAT